MHPFSFISMNPFYSVKLLADIKKILADVFTFGTRTNVVSAYPRSCNTHTGTRGLWQLQHRFHSHSETSVTMHW